MISLDEALRRIERETAPLPAEQVPLDAALCRVLAEEVVADRDFPATDRSAMDGFAVRAADLATGGGRLRVIGEARAGAPTEGLRVGSGEACRIFTGAVVPHGADAVVMVEQTREDRATGIVDVEDRPKPGQHVRPRGKDLHEGEPVLREGSRVRAAEIAALASVGHASVTVHRAPRVAVLSTGDELIPVEARPEPYQVRNSNTPMLRAQLAESGLGCTELAHAGDDTAALSASLRGGFDHDLLLITGGVSVGEYDLVGRALEAEGMRLIFHKVAMKPGKPLLAGRRGPCLVLGLPGNPLSAFVGYLLFAAPALRRMQGLAEWRPQRCPARLAVPLRRRPGRETLHLARVESIDGERVAHPVASTGSGDVLSIARANGFVITPPDAGDQPAGTLLASLAF